MEEEQLISMYLPYPGAEDRLVRVFVPAHGEGQTLPVIYMTDGQNLFDVESSGFGCWYTREAVRRERECSGRAAVIVGIHNEDPLRMPELTPAGPGGLKEPEAEGLEPRGEVFDDFLVNTVMPAVQARFPVRTGRENTAFCGSSAGGMFSFFTALSHPELFSAAGVLSPCFALYRQQELAAWIRSRRTRTPAFLYLFCGAGDRLEQFLLGGVHSMLPVLEACWPGDRLKTVLRPEARHHETAWEPVFRDFLHDFLARCPEDSRRPE